MYALTALWRGQVAGGTLWAPQLDATQKDGVIPDPEPLWLDARRNQMVRSW